MRAHRSPPLVDLGCYAQQARTDSGLRTGRRPRLGQTNLTGSQDFDRCKCRLRGKRMAGRRALSNWRDPTWRALFELTSEAVMLLGSSIDLLTISRTAIRCGMHGTTGAERDRRAIRAGRCRQMVMVMRVQQRQHQAQEDRNERERACQSHCPAWLVHQPADDTGRTSVRTAPNGPPCRIGAKFMELPLFAPSSASPSAIATPRRAVGDANWLPLKLLSTCNRPTSKPAACASTSPLPTTAYV